MPDPDLAIEAYVRWQRRMTLDLQHIPYTLVYAGVTNVVMSRTRVQQIEKAALAKIRKALSDVYAQGELPLRLDRLSDVQRANVKRNRQMLYHRGATAERVVRGT